ncbi:hypothetical protein EDEG_03234 [Edhazardia aedis USNM 41457]|uniref:Uncharacterized protein n=1 Tax=Edhazardia aedis (strain USNM 41457) TaxID=1003232 RepID=J9DLS7_EDHAE|nr:hypothetical protein EDEG_03234 [Edhazardia aedis USNM 41457]|eukprot:EJW02332.1 hypothetical protein EDEG_03234 [Edhazardia aedis USNM 41457]
MNAETWQDWAKIFGFVVLCIFALFLLLVLLRAIFCAPKFICPRFMQNIDDLHLYLPIKSAETKLRSEFAKKLHEECLYLRKEFIEKENEIIFNKKAYDDFLENLRLSATKFWYYFYSEAMKDMRNFAVGEDLRKNQIIVASLVFNNIQITLYNFKRKETLRKKCFVKFHKQMINILGFTMSCIHRRFNNSEYNESEANKKIQELDKFEEKEFLKLLEIIREGPNGKEKEIVEETKKQNNEVILEIENAAIKYFEIAEDIVSKIPVDLRNGMKYILA